VLVLSVDRVAAAQFGARWEGGSHGDRPAERPCADPWVAVPRWAQAGAAIRGPMGGGAAVGPGGGAAVRGPVGGGVATGPGGNVAVRGPAGNVAVGSRGSYTNVYGGTYPYYGWGAVAAGAAVGAAAGAVAAYYPYYPQPYYQPPCGPPYSPPYPEGCPYPY